MVVSQVIVSIAGCINESLRSVGIGYRSDSTYLTVHCLSCGFVSGCFLCCGLEVGIRFLCCFERSKVSNQFLLVVSQVIVSIAGGINESLRSVGIGYRSDSIYLTVHIFSCGFVCGCFLCSSFEVSIRFLCGFKGSKVSNQFLLVVSQGIVRFTGIINESLRIFAIFNLSDSTYLIVHVLGGNRGVQFSY